MNRIVNPLIPLDSPEGDAPTIDDVNEFLDLSIEPNERGTKFFSTEWIAKNYDGSEVPEGKHPI